MKYNCVSSAYELLTDTTIVVLAEMVSCVTFHSFTATHDED